MPAAAQDQRVRRPIPSLSRSFTDQLQRLSVTETAPARCTALCCSPLLPQLNRNAASQDCFQPAVIASPASTSDRNAVPSSPTSSTMRAGTDGVYEPQNDGEFNLDDYKEVIDKPTFEQILEMDDDEDEREFSRSIVYDFFAQAESTFDKMNTSLEQKDLAQLSALGHFLKGSSATLGLTKVKDACEKIQHFGAKQDETGSHDEPDETKCLENCKQTIKQAKAEFWEVERVLKRFYES